MSAAHEHSVILRKSIGLELVLIFKRSRVMNVYRKSVIFITLDFHNFYMKIVYNSIKVKKIAA